MEPGETVEQAVIQEAQEETFLDLIVEGLVGVYSEPGRDPRGSSVSIAYHATFAGGAPALTQETTAFRWLEPGEECAMGCDDEKIVSDFRKAVIRTTPAERT